MDDAIAPIEEPEPTQVNSAMDDEERMGSEHAFGTTNINGFQPFTALSLSLSRTVSVFHRSVLRLATSRRLRLQPSPAAQIRLQPSPAPSSPSGSLTRCFHRLHPFL
nr:hypothetical protein Itr_chr01CG02320 [Ipomoea trifida]